MDNKEKLNKEVLENETTEILETPEVLEKVIDTTKTEETPTDNKTVKMAGDTEVKPSAETKKTQKTCPLKKFKAFLDKNEIFHLSFVLGVITSVTALCLAFVNSITAPIIDEMKNGASNEAMQSIVVNATSFEEQEVEDANILTFHNALSGDAIVGYCVKVAPSGYGGPIEMIVGLDENGAVLGTSIIDMSETSGLGTRIEEPSFAEQFIGKDSAIAIGVDIDAISGATVSSAAMTKGVSTAIEFVSIKLGNSVAVDPAEVEADAMRALVENAEEFEDTGLSSDDVLSYKIATAGGETIAHFAKVAPQGFVAPIEFIVAIDNDGSIIGTTILSIDESVGFGSKLETETSFAEQFINLSGTVSAGSDIDVIAGATVSSEAFTLGVNNALAFVAENK